MSTRRKPSAHHAVLNLNVTGGFLAGAKLDFADGLNCLIGGRGTGKTTALEFLRFGLGLMPDPKISAARHRAIEGLVKANLGGGRLAIELRTKDGMRYTARRGVSDDLQVLNEAGTAVPVSLDRELIFTADVFSQNEIEEIASDPAAQLALLDRFVPETTTLTTELDALHRQLDQMTNELRRLDNEADNLRATASELPIVEEKLKGLTQGAGPDADKITAAHAAKSARDREAQLPEQLTQAVDRATQDIASSMRAFRAVLDAHLDSKVKAGPNLDIITTLDADMETFAKSVEGAEKGVSAAATIVKQAIGVRRASIAQRHATQDDEYRKLIAVLAEEGGRAAERASLQQKLMAAATAQTQVDAMQMQRDLLQKRRSETLQKISELRDTRFAARKRVAEKLTQQFPAIRVKVAQGADLQAYKDLLANALRGARMKHAKNAERLAEVLLPEELSKAVASRDHKVIVQRAGFDADLAKRILDTLHEEGAAYVLEAVELHDVPSIELLDGTEYKASPNLSTGQRCTTILPILLVQSERPLLIDQPEDNLDNAFIYETVVKALQAVRGARQVIFVTHNPNIPVLGEAERVFVFESDGKQARLRKEGSVDECKADIETILEGGREAFRRRKERYGH